MKCPRCEGLVRVGKQGEYSRCFQCGYHDWTTPMPKPRKRTNIMYVRYAKSGSNSKFEGKILKLKILSSSRMTSRSNSRPHLITSCPFHCEGETEAKTYSANFGYTMVCPRGHTIKVKLNLAVPKWS